MRIFVPIVLAGLVMFGVGCAGHYRNAKITESTTGRTYYARYATSDWLGLSFKDAKTGKLVRIEQGAEVRQLTREEFEIAVGR